MSAFFPDPIPTLTDKQEQMVRRGVCPACEKRTLIVSGEGEGLRILGCLRCHSIAVLPATGELQLAVMPARRTGRTFLAQKITVALRQHLVGYCAEGDRCVCGGDLPSIRAGCGSWRTP